MEHVVNLKNELRLSWDLEDGGQVLLGIRTPAPMSPKMLQAVSYTLHSIEQMVKDMEVKADADNGG